MLIVIDKRIPDIAKRRLGKFGKIVEFATKNITYEAISGHPDIFLCQTPETLICAPNLPEYYFALFEKNNINYSIGKNPVGFKFPATSFYNCVINEKFLFHKKTNTDNRILELNKELEFIDFPQAYTRCSLMALPFQNFFTSDKGIENALLKHNLNVRYFSPNEILLPNMPHGFIGGATGFYSGKLFVLGNPDFHSWGKEFRLFIEKQNIELISLYDGSFFDGGGIFFLE
jgi:hypothetical protein